MEKILAADIGGTNSRFGYFQAVPNGGLELVEKCRLPTSGAASFGQILEQLASSGFSLAPDHSDVAVIAVAGPVDRGVFAAPPNISWTVDLAAGELTGKLPRAHLINDFVAQAYACASPMGRAAPVILAGEPVKDGVRCVLGGGTGLGKAILVSLSQSRFTALPSEGGHALFPFVSEKEWAFQAFYREKSGQDEITGDMVVSGRGLRYLHWFLAGEDLPPPDAAARFDRTPETLLWMARFYGRTCRDSALEVLARGGLFIAGGVATANPEILRHEAFQRAFRGSSTMGRLLEKIPVYLLDNPDSGLWGAAFHGQQLLQGMLPEPG